MATDTNALYEVGVMVFAKVKGYPYWPAVIKGVTKTDRTTKYNVTFFGDENTANFKQNDMCLYSEYKLIHGKPKTDNFKNKKFHEALKEAETFFKNPSCNKSLTESNSNKTLKGYISQDSILESTLPELEESLIESELQNGEDSLIMAAKLGKALLKENMALKEDNRSISLQVQKIKEQTTYPKEPYNNPVLTISDKQRPIPTCIPRDKGGFEVIEVEAMFHRENICTMPESKDYKKTSSEI
ncbi:PC4 and SFRS1-interacting protein [Homalodisca vitripennis]|nr:PC4 and SFRS1-interacting protein [Homalodisca vitripennis]